MRQLNHITGPWGGSYVELWVDPWCTDRWFSVHFGSEIKAFCLFIGLVHGFKVDVVGKIESPEEVHDKCDQSQIDSELYPNCTLAEQQTLECSKDQCGGQKQVCDCNVYR